MHGLADYWIYSFANDKKGDLWIGTWAGLSLVRRGATIGANATIVCGAKIGRYAFIGAGAGSGCDFRC